jgi:hypothetical protein
VTTVANGDSEIGSEKGMYRNSQIGDYPESGRLCHFRPQRPPKVIPFRAALHEGVESVVEHDFGSRNGTGLVPLIEIPTV